MSDRKLLEKMLGHALSGKGAHVEAKHVFEGLDWKTAGFRPEGAPHSAYQLLKHLNYWQDWVVKWLDGEEPPLPGRAAASWPGETAPASSKEWKQSVAHFQKGLEELRRRSLDGNLLAAGGRKSRLEMLQTVASHNSYHLGQAVSLRQRLGAWPPPSGGLTW